MEATTLRTNFNRDGFLIVEDFFDEAEMAVFDAAITRYIREIAPTLPPDRVFYEQPGGAIKSINRLDEHDAFFADFKRHPRFLALIAEIFQTDQAQIISESLQFFGKPAYEGSITPLAAGQRLSALRASGVADDLACARLRG
jgi:Phytanoyl-CoA dioxygenase (PhyH)